MWRRRVVPTRVAIYRVDSGDCDWNGNGGGGWELEDYARVGTIPLGVEDASRKVCSLR